MLYGAAAAGFAGRSYGSDALQCNGMHIPGGSDGLDGLDSSDAENGFMADIYGALLTQSALIRIVLEAA